MQVRREGQQYRGIHRDREGRGTLAFLCRRTQSPPVVRTASMWRVVVGDSSKKKTIIVDSLQLVD